MNSAESHKHWPLFLLLLVGFCLRAGLVYMERDSLLLDRDLYIGIARQLIETGEYAHPDTGKLTAYRPPLYPCFLAIGFQVMDPAWFVALSNLVFAVATIWLAHRLCLELKFTPLAHWGIVTVITLDPILIRYTPQAMTETLFTFLVLALVVLMIRWHESMQWKQQAAIGVLLGLCGLCRPTIWAFAGLWGMFELYSKFLKRRLFPLPFEESLQQRLKALPWIAWTVALAMAAPWVVRNYQSLGRPILTTTHGGYTLLLGNNPVFYAEVVNDDSRDVWDGQSLRKWQNELELDLASAHDELSETERDYGLYHRARANIRKDQRSFIKACWLRITRLWSPTPTVSGGLPSIVVYGVGVFYTLLLIGLLPGMFHLKRNPPEKLVPMWLLLLAFTIVHCFYWSNARMRAPLIPFVAVFGVTGWYPIYHFCRHTRDFWLKHRNGNDDNDY